MLSFDNINIWAVVVAWVINCAVGAYWYSPMGFAKKWEKYTGINLLKIPEKEATNTLIAVVLSGLVQAFALAAVITSLNITTAMDGLGAGLLLWLGFTTATTVGVTLYSRRSWKFLWLNSSYFLVVMSINSVIVAVWR